MRRWRHRNGSTPPAWLREAPAVLLVLLATRFLGTGEPAESGDPTTLAYLDPGVGSLMIQMLIAAFAGAAVALKIFWKRIVRFLGFRAARPAEEETERKSASDE